MINEQGPITGNGKLITGHWEAFLTVSRTRSKREGHHNTIQLGSPSRQQLHMCGEQRLLLHSEPPSSQQSKTLLKSLRTTKAHITAMSGNREQQNLQITLSRNKPTIPVALRAPTHWSPRSESVLKENNATENGTGSIDKNKMWW